MDPAAAPTTAQLFHEWTFRPEVIAPLVIVAALYVWGAVRVRRRHPAKPWPWPRTLSFFCGLGVIVVSLLSAVEIYNTTFFWVHMIQHLLLIMVAPALIILGRPLILSMHATRNPWHTRIKRFLRSRAVTVVTSPFISVPLYIAAVVATHLTSFNNLVVLHHGWAVFEEFGYLVAGYLYLLSGFGEEPIRWHLARPTKMILLVLTMPVDTFVGITLLMTTNEPWPAYAAQHHTWGPSLINDVHYGGAMMWAGGDTIMIVLVVNALIPWVIGRNRNVIRMRWIDSARKATMDRYADYLPPTGGRIHDVDEDERRLDAYNAWLAAMSARDRAARQDTL